MASVHLGRLLGPVGFSRTVAIKRLHENFAKDPEFVAMFLDEARLVARISHPNVVPTLDVVALERELLLVMEYVSGESLMALLRQCRETTRPAPIPVAVDIVIGMLNGLHAAHEATSESGELLNIVHRDVSPHNVLVGVDGVTRVVDFGIAKATNTTHQTRAGEVKGKLSYMAPEQLEGAAATRSADIYSAAVVLWEALTCKQLFKGKTDGATIHSVLKHEIVTPSRIRSDVPLALDAIVRRGLEVDPSKRWETAKAMAEALERAVRPVTRRTVGEWVTETARDEIRQRQERVVQVESNVMPSRPPSMPAPPMLLETPQAGGSSGTAQHLSQVISQRPGDALRRISLTVVGVISVVVALLAIWVIAPGGIRQPRASAPLSEPARLSAAIPTLSSGILPRALPPGPTASPTGSSPTVTERVPAPALLASGTASAQPAPKPANKKRTTPVAPPRAASPRATIADSLYRRD